MRYQCRSYRNPNAGISRLVQRGDLIRLKRGLYLSAWAGGDPYRLVPAANRLYGPSYVSFEYALRWYGLIPEHVAHITSATFRRNRSKRFDTPVGSFLSRDVPSTAYPYSVLLERRGGNYDDLRMDRTAYMRLDRDSLVRLSRLYRTETLSALGRYAGRRVQA